MGNHWSAIGIHSQEELAEVIQTAYETPSRHFQDLDAGQTYLLTDGSIELWLHFDAQCVVPSFASSTVIQAIATRWIEDESHSPYYDMLCVELLDSNGYRLCPLAVTFGNVPQARRLIDMGESINLNLSVFIERGEYWDSVESYRKAYPDRKFAPGFFVPLGPFSALENCRDNSPRAAFFGVVQQIQWKENPWTGHSYQCLSLECGSSLYEAVVADENLMNLAVGNLVYVECWLCTKYL
ncbi:MAG: hypothetical protein AAF215_34690 [Cyanobacteria bacterium P01_A01_bin.123]